MNYSQFNSIIKYGDHYSIYNSFSDKYLIINQEIKELIEYSQKEGSHIIKQVHPSLYESLCKNGFLVNKNEVDEVKKISDQIENSEEDFVLTVNPTMNCNFKCWYCYENHIKGSKINEDVLNRIFKYIHSIFLNKPNLKRFTINFFGGEPLLYFDEICYPIMNLVQRLCNSYQVERYIGFTTNGYLINNRMIEKFKEFKKIFFQITLDGYKEEHDTIRFNSNNKGSYDTIIKNITTLLNEGFYVSQRINYTPDKLKNSFKILNDLTNIKSETKRNLKTSFHCVWQARGLPDYRGLLTQMKKFENADIPTECDLRLRGYKEPCYADLRNSAVINFNGDLFKCTARNFNSQNREGYLNEEGEAIWDSVLIEKRMNSKFKNNSCLSCRLLPVCNGGCSQNKLEVKGEYCTYGFDDNRKNNAIKFRIDRLVLLNKINKKKLVPSPIKLMEV